MFSYFNILNMDIMIKNSENVFDVVYKIIYNNNNLVYLY